MQKRAWTRVKISPSAEILGVGNVAQQRQHKRHPIRSQPYGIKHQTVHAKFELSLELHVT